MFGIHTINELKNATQNDSKVKPCFILFKTGEYLKIVVLENVILFL